MNQILLMIAMAPSSDQIGGIIFALLAFLCVGGCLLGGLVILIMRFVRKKVQGDDPAPPEEIPPHPGEGASDDVTRVIESEAQLKKIKDANNAERKSKEK
jgi:hypothetical protein